MNWHNLLKKEKKKKYFKKIVHFINKEKKIGKIILPKTYDIFNAFKFTKFKNIKVVILGQDPYCKLNQANGLAFSVNYGINIPPSLKNIYKELKNNIKNIFIPNHGYLKKWAKQGVMLLNTILTVELNKPYSHANIGWQKFTDKVIKIINKKKKIVFLLWGYHAQKKENIINQKNNYILKTSHPSPFSANKGFLGCKHFLKTNILLKKKKIHPINWNI